MAGLRFSIAGLMGIVMVAAVGLAALTKPSEIWAGAMLLLTCGILALAVVGAIYREGPRRAWWLGVSVFGWGYMALSAFWPEDSLFHLPTTRALEVLGPRLGSPLHPNWAGPPAVDQWFERTGQYLWVLLAALLGGLLARFGLADRADPREGSRPDALEADQPQRSRWLRPTIAGLVALVLLAAFATIWWGASAPLWAGLSFALTCAFLGLILLGAFLGRSRSRSRWLGAALFGAGYAALVFSRPMGQPPWAYLPTDLLFGGIRPWFPTVARSMSPENARILDALERPIPMRFDGEATLESLLNHIKRATATPTPPGIPIYVDPIGLQEAERSLQSTVQLDLEGVPLKETLRLSLKQLGLAYQVKGGYLWLTSEEEGFSPELEDPFLIVGHCLVVLVAAGVGAMAAPIVAGAARG
jgi:hypothetical protein